MQQTDTVTPEDERDRDQMFALYWELVDRNSNARPHEQTKRAITCQEFQTWALAVERRIASRRPRHAGNVFHTVQPRVPLRQLEQQNMTPGLRFRTEAKQSSIACKRRLRIMKAATHRACGNNVDNLP
ncbi:hypothetical protein GOZ83_06385 [Agrobacterium vitis]|uniref:hypothetical protein n=1 Tax=Rhizobium/Agrobacterium group TaxID=227290 RepID=UPI0012E79B20|nr:MULTISPECIES: hypothetical protein [Rhizobium/Agrobacterium group]MCF1492666.1 hypothetical protein [Allorhizobium ampelinum]MVA44710.1 hypothetical protein [Agrobacterium vitis]